MKVGRNREKGRNISCSLCKKMGVKTPKNMRLYLEKYIKQKERDMVQAVEHLLNKPRPCLNSNSSNTKKIQTDVLF
jgi:hypothetical protein